MFEVHDMRTSGEAKIAMGSHDANGRITHHHGKAVRDRKWSHVDSCASHLVKQQSP